MIGSPPRIPPPPKPHHGLVNQLPCSFKPVSCIGQTGRFRVVLTHRWDQMNP